MGRRGQCAICVREDSSAIHQELKGRSTRSVAEQFGVSISTLQRHANSCMRQSDGPESTGYDGEGVVITPEISARLAELNEKAQRMRSPGHAKEVVRELTALICDMANVNQ